MTNFFGSVMVTIHTDSAKLPSPVKKKSPVASRVERLLLNSNDLDQIRKLNTEVKFY